MILEGIYTIEAEDVVRILLRTFYRQYSLLTVIVTDRGPQFIGALWTRFYELLSIVRRVSTAFHPQTDGSTERMNQTVETYLRTYINRA